MSSTEANNDVVVIHTDGGCVPNPGTGGWGAVLEYQGRRKELSGGERNTTNNRMELMAAIKALESLKRPCKVIMYTDSEYLQKGVSQWMPSWRRRGWKRKGGEIKNLDLWRELDRLGEIHDIDWRWLRGHAGHPENERCDELASQAIASLKSGKAGARTAE